MKRPKLQKIIINRIWAMPSKWTFSIKPIIELLEKYNVGKGWADPFTGNSQLAEYRNDLNPENINAQYHLESSEFADIVSENLMGVLFDPPYSLHNVMQHYKSFGKEQFCKENPTGNYKKTRDILSKKIKPTGLVISFGWNSVGFGKKRGFKIIEILLVSHGGNRNDTIVTVEQKIT